jgi:hypothetical protein
MLSHGPWWKRHLKLVWLEEFWMTLSQQNRELGMNIAQCVDSTLSGVGLPQRHDPKLNATLTDDSLSPPIDCFATSWTYDNRM